MKRFMYLLCVASLFLTTSCDKEMMETLMNMADSTQNSGTNDTIPSTPSTDTVPVNPGQDTILPTPGPQDTVPVNPGQDTVLPTPTPGPQDTTFTYGDPQISTLFSGEAVNYTTYDAYYYCTGDTCTFILKAWMGSRDGATLLPMLQMGWLLIDGRYYLDFCEYYDDAEKVNHMYELYGAIYGDWYLYSVESGTIDYDFDYDVLANAEFTFTLYDFYAHTVEGDSIPQMAMIDISLQNIDFEYVQLAKSNRNNSPKRVARKATAPVARLTKSPILR